MDRAEFRRHLKVMIAAKCAGDAPPPELLRPKIRAIIRGNETSLRPDALPFRPVCGDERLDGMDDLGTLLGIWAHPDDETYLSAGLMARRSVDGRRVVCVTATRGEGGSMDEERWPPDDDGGRSARPS